METLVCPSCGSPHFRKTSAVDYLCENCNTRFKLSDNQAYLLLVRGTLCPVCHFDNDENIRFCEQCGAALVKKCQYCGVETQVDRKFCGNCGKPSFSKAVQGATGLFDLVLTPVRGDYRKIDTIKLIRKLTDASLADAKRMSEERTVVGYALAAPEAEKLKLEFESFGARVELVPSSGKKPVVVSAPQAVQAKKEGCFIATAALGDYNHPDVIALRKLRDRQLLQTPAGEWCVRVYYEYSPVLAVGIAQSGWLKQVVFHLLVRPLAGFSRWLNG